jgi:DNA replication protein DnaC
MDRLLVSLGYPSDGSEPDLWARKVLETMRSAEIPGRYRHFRPLSASPVTETVPELVRRLRVPVLDDEDEAAQDTLIAEWDRWSWFLWGDVGRGKTGLAVGHAFERIWTNPSGTANERGEWPALLFLWTARWLQDLRDAMDRRDHLGEARARDLMDKARFCRLLILDELGTDQPLSNWAREQLTLLIADRYAEERPVIFTTNLTLGHLWEEDMLGERLASRIYEWCGGDERVIQVAGPNLRDT